MTLYNISVFIILLIYLVMIVSCVVVVLKENRNPIRSLSWVIALIFLPVVGWIFYIFFGRSLKGMHLISKRKKRKLMNVFRTPKVDLECADLSADERQLAKLAHTLTSFPLTVNNSLEIFTEGEAKFKTLKHDLRQAREYIFLQYYIFADDNIGREIADILISKASEGVKVYVIYDHVGSFSARSRFFRHMAEGGVQLHPFFKVSFPQLANRINWRNHRKIVVIDGVTGYIGGMNIADRYISEPGKGKVWRDTHLRLRGDIVEQLAFSFAMDWSFLKQTPPLELPRRIPSSLSNTLGMQLVTSGPTSLRYNIALCFLKAISNAKKSIFIQTPYLLPTDALLNALEAAALAKVDVRIMIPRISDSRLLRLASFSYVTQCLRSGIKVYLYTPGMLHAKMMIVDDDLVTTGSTNFDFRSFENNFECSLLIYDRATNRRMRDLFFHDLENCTKLTVSDWKKRPLPQRISESIVRLLAPIL